jgi:hypothetical protein
MLEINRGKSTTYMACPYSSYPQGREESFRLANLGAAHLMVEHNRVVFSPITHSHVLDNYTEDPTHSFWLTQDYYWIVLCDELCVLKLEGWDRSFGIGWELALAEERGKDIWYLEEDVVVDWALDRGF